MGYTKIEQAKTGRKLTIEVTADGWTSTLENEDGTSLVDRWGLNGLACMTEQTKTEIKDNAELDEHLKEEIQLMDFTDLSIMLDW